MHRLFFNLLVFCSILISYAQPAMNVSQSGGLLVDGDSYDFGLVGQESTRSFTFTIENTNSDTLVIDGLTLAPTSYFTITSPLQEDSIKGIGSLDFEVTLTTDCAIQTHSALITLETNDPTSPVFELTLNGTAVGIVETADAGTDATICDVEYTLAANTPTLTTGEWTLVNGSGTFSDDTSPSSLVENIAVGINTYRWSLYNGNCLVDEADVVITRDAFPGPVDAGTDNLVCGNNAVSLVATTPTVGSGLWTAIDNAGIIQNPTSAISSVTNLNLDTNTFVWTVSDPGSSCDPIRDTVLIVRDEIPTQSNAGTNKNICADSYKLDANTPLVGTGTWSVVSGTGNFQNINSDSSIVSGFTLGANVYRWTIRSKYQFCSSSSTQVTVFRDTEPTIIDAGDDVTVCEDTISLNATPPDVGVGQWIVSSGNSTVLEPMNPTSKVENLNNGTNTFIWIVTSGSCTSSPDAVIVDRDDDLTPADAGEDVFLCKDSSITLQANTPIKGFGQWTRTVGNANILNISNENTEVKQLSIGQNTFVWTISSGTCTPSHDTVSIFRDGVFPTIDCPGDIVVNNDNGLCGAVVNYTTPIGTDNCPDPITTQLSGLTSGSVFPVGVTTNTFEVADFYDYTASCSFDVTVIDATLPQITCVDTIKQNNSLDDCGKVVSFTLPVGTDNCSPATTLQTDGTGLTSGSFFPIGNTTLEFTATDQGGNSVSCKTVVSVKDIQDPTISCPSDISQDLTFGNCDAFITYPDPVIDDNCVNDELQFQLTSGLPSGSTFPSGQTTNTFIVTDSSGNTATCSFTVDINDVETPVITCPANVTSSNDPGDCSATIIPPAPTVNDICNNSTINIIQGAVQENNYPVGTTTVTYEVEDDAGNADQCSFDITVVDDEDPIITCPGPINEAVSPGLCEAVAAFNAPVGNDNCTGFSINQIDVTGLSSGDAFPVGTTTLTYEIEDASGNTASCDVVITIVDNEAPQITCPANVSTSTANGLCAAQVFYNAPVGTDNCGISSTLQSDATGLSSGNNFPVGETTLTYTTEDLSGNSSSCSFKVFVTDENDPTITCPNDTTVYTAAGFCGVNVNYFDPLVVDLCGPASFSRISGKTKGASFGLGIHDIIYEAVDTAGNTSQCTFSITVLDTIKPQILCSNDVEIFTASGVCTAPYSFGLPIATDNCDSVRVEQVLGPNSGSNFPLGTTGLAFVAYDSTGNKSDTCHINVTVLDRQGPNIDCPSNMTLCTEGVANFTAATATDNCSSVINIVQTSGPTSGTSLTVGSYVVTFQATDEYNNSSSCATSIEVYDTTVLPDAGTDASICETTASISGNSPKRSGVGSWSTTSGATIVSPTFSSSNVINMNASGEYVFVYTFDRGICGIQRDTLRLTKNPNPGPAEVPSDILLCGTNNVLISAELPTEGTGAWSLGSGIGTVTPISITSANFEGLPTDSNKVYWTVSNGLCPDAVDSMIVTVSENPVIIIEQPEPALYLEPVTFDVNGDTAYSYLWEPFGSFVNPFDQNATGAFTQTRYVYLTAINDIGCSSIDSVQIEILNDLKIYTGLTPNGDGTNDNWVIRGIQAYPNASIEVFTQWGQPVFSSIGYSTPWDGTNGGKQLPFGPYYFVIDLGNGDVKKGTVTILR